MLDIEIGLKEIQEKTEEEIEKETAIKWGSLSAGAYLLSTQATNVGQKMSWLLTAEDKRHESLEHSSLIGDNGVFLSELQLELDKYRDEAVQSLVNILDKNTQE